MQHLNTKWQSKGLTGLETLTGEAIEGQSAEEAYRQSSRLMERIRRKQHQAEVLTMAQEHLNEEKEYKPATKEARRSVGAKLLQQLVTKRQKVAVRNQEGRLCAGAKHIGKALITHWRSLMKFLNTGVADCPMHIRGCDPPLRWSTADYPHSGRSRTKTQCSRRSKSWTHSPRQE